MNVMDASELYDPEFRELIKSKNPTIIIPVGSLEQHGAHLPITTDSDIVTEIASRLAKKCRFIVFPAINYGISFEHEPLFNTSITHQRFGNYIESIISSLSKNGIKSIIILNGHHGNISVVERVMSYVTNPNRIQLRGTNRTKTSQDGRNFIMKTTKQIQTRFQKEFKDVSLKAYSYWHFMKHEFDHAGFVETSIMLAISDKVKMKKAKKGLIITNMAEADKEKLKKRATRPGGFPKVAENGVWGDPTKATKKDGEKFLAEIVRNLAKECQS